MENYKTYLFSGRNYSFYDRDIAFYIGSDAAILLARLGDIQEMQIDRDKWDECKITFTDLQKRLNWGEKRLKNTVDALKNHGLFDYTVKGIPKAIYYILRGKNLLEWRERNSTVRNEEPCAKEAKTDESSLENNDMVRNQFRPKDGIDSAQKTELKTAFGRNLHIPSKEIHSKETPIVETAVSTSESLHNRLVAYFDYGYKIMANGGPEAKSEQFPPGVGQYAILREKTPLGANWIEPGGVITNQGGRLLEGKRLNWSKSKKELASIRHICDRLRSEYTTIQSDHEIYKLAIGPDGRMGIFAALSKCDPFFASMNFLPSQALAAWDRLTVASLARTPEGQSRIKEYGKAARREKNDSERYGRIFGGDE